MLCFATDNSGSAVESSLDTQRVSLNRFFQSVERRALRMAEISVGSRDDALDIVQDTMMALAERYAARPEAEWTPLFYRILQTRIISWHRSHNRRRRWILFAEDFRSSEDEDAPDILEQLAVDTGSPEDIVSTAQVQARLEAVLRDLPLRQQQAFLLRVWEGLDVSGTAKAMKCSEGSVKTHLFRAMARLREALGEGFSA